MHLCWGLTAAIAKGPSPADFSTENAGSRIGGTAQPNVSTAIPSQSGVRTTPCEPLERPSIVVLDRKHHLAVYRCQTQQSTPTIGDTRNDTPGGPIVLARGRQTLSAVLKIGCGGDDSDRLSWYQRQCTGELQYVESICLVMVHRVRLAGRLIMLF